jgi:hypothetical protein
VAAATTASLSKSIGRREGDANCRHSGKKKSDLSAHGTYLSQAPTPRRAQIAQPVRPRRYMPLHGANPIRKRSIQAEIGFVVFPYQLFGGP